MFLVLDKDPPVHGIDSIVVGFDMHVCTIDLHFDVSILYGFYYFLVSMVVGVVFICIMTDV